MISEDDIERAMYHPLFRRRVLEILRNAGVLPPSPNMPEPLEEERPGRGPQRKKPAPSITEGLALEDLGIYVPIEEAASKFNLTTEQLREAVINSWVRARAGDGPVMVELETVAAWQKGRAKFLAKEAKRNTPPPAPKMIGLHVVGETRPEKKKADRPEDSFTYAEAGSMLGIKANTVEMYCSTKRLERVARGFVSGASIRALQKTPATSSVDAPMVKAPKGYTQPKVKGPRPKDAVTYSEAAHMLGWKLSTLPQYLTTGKLKFAGAGYVSLESIRTYAAQRGLELKELPEPVPV